MDLTTNMCLRVPGECVCVGWGGGGDARGAVGGYVLGEWLLFYNNSRIILFPLRKYILRAR